WRLFIRYMWGSFPWVWVVWGKAPETYGRLSLDGAEHDPLDEVPLDEGVDQQDGDDREHDRHRLDVRRHRHIGLIGADERAAGGSGDEVAQVDRHREQLGLVHVEEGGEPGVPESDSVE